MKRFLILFLICLSVAQAVQPASKLSGLDPQVRDYLSSVEVGMRGDAAYRSYSALSLSTAVFNATTTTYSFPIQLVGSADERMQWFSDSITTFSISDSTAATVGVATLGSSTTTFYAGSGGISVTLTGTWSIGDTVTVSFPALTDGVLDSAVGSQVLTFTY